MDTGRIKKKKRKGSDSLKRIKKLLIILTLAFFVVLITIVCINFAVKKTTENRILTTDELDSFSFDYILVLGCGVNSDGSPSHMLYDRVYSGVEAFKTGCAEKLLMSGDHRDDSYNEVGTMQTLATQLGVNEGSIECDHSGFSTFESVYRAKRLYGAEKMLIVTQEYHLYRAMYIAEALGVEAYGFSADLREYRGQSARDLREIFARIKDFLLSHTVK